jgi:hypothetical protein
MDKLDWKMINDYEFVHMVADLLRELGFIDIHIQGDGPDGGVDLFATEVVPFAIQGSLSFRWAIQCKFSTGGKRRAVNDEEVRDIEGILQSDRYQAQSARGYMLITNRRIAQNVIERLTGINRRTQFRTSCIDGIKLQQFLTDHYEIVEKYLEISRLSKTLGSPIIITNANKHIDSSTASLEIEIISPTINQNRTTTMAFIDTGSNLSSVPIKDIVKLALPRHQSYGVKVYAGERTILDSFIVNVQIDDISLPNIEVFAINNEDYAVIGWNVIRQLAVLFDGDLIRLWKRQT